MNKQNAPTSNPNRRASGKERAMRTPSFAFVRVTANGHVVVQAMGDEAPFGNGVCGATFCTSIAAKLFLLDHGFEPTGIQNVWQR